ETDRGTPYLGVAAVERRVDQHRVRPLQLAVAEERLVLLAEGDRLGGDHDLNEGVLAHDVGLHIVDEQIDVEQTAL
ncbi:hypothetical protein, partial [Escherichia coli]|uniref:hypothetical protein n=1 Tax=Escherichia coli TaxID=562 RepID=UPI00385B1A19